MQSCAVWFVQGKEQLRRAIEEQEGVSQVSFARAYYLEEVNQHADERAVDLHYDRFKSLLKGEDKTDRSPERIAAYCNFFNRKYKKEGVYTQADRHAAWELYIELETRIATQPLENGTEKAALKSLAALFNLHRDIARCHGPNCRYYHDKVQSVFESVLRPFTSKWHQLLSDDNNDDFRKDLVVIQQNLGDLKENLKEMSV